mmetsp:Transcript_1121/g.2410  ORF Transcript_1121/g.2410 Transcript_1121/m.2410 type:complete len:630 (-) Transcript_1121:237-2126(-)|eukprot:CAMPEP_0172527358 /NCGR_PEP_ID=MMETSP1067-20121228/2066_1 /TAXON_ID=265564 ORGANISM="Thalassiosira punctigera, Strain Tpunct2005C2" /NCGR_SAMPLE_ID=MMETSP1067 /ASSEMBLY_ACC=CAM_ASM_000444 /LENGTH=629 /DNA_ID=CAMNT_0013311085 /DNA_START=146 /DNA_END=2035 /DNA_ORIENTATION=-
MSQNPGGRGRGRGGRAWTQRKGVRKPAEAGPKAFRSKIKEIEDDTFNVGHNKFKAQFDESRENVASYVARTIGGEHGNLVAKEIKTGERQRVDFPPALAANADPDEAAVRQVLVEGVGKSRLKLKGARPTGFSIVMAQCSQAVKDKIHASENFETIDENSEVHHLITLIQRVCTGFEEHRAQTYGIVEAMFQLHCYVQEYNQSVSKYIKNHKALWEASEAFGASPGFHDGLAMQWLANAHWVADRNAPTREEHTRAARESSEAVQACMLIYGADQQRFGELKADLNNDYLKGNDCYPKTVERARNLLENWERTHPIVRANPRQTPYSAGVAMAQRQVDGGGAGRGRGAGRGGRGGRGTAAKAPAKEADGDKKEKKTNSSGESHCFNCGSLDHWARDCPQLEEEQTAELHMAVEGLGVADEEEYDEYEEANNHHQAEAQLLAQVVAAEDKIFLDSCTTTSTFINEKHLSDVKDEARGLAIKCNAGTVKTKRRGDFGGLKVWSMGSGIANVLSLAEVSQKYRVTFDSEDGYFLVHTPRGEVKFLMDESGMPCLDLASNEQAATMLIQTVRGNYEGFTPREIKEAREAAEAKAMMHHPSDQALREVGENHQEKGGTPEGSACGDPQAGGGEA